MDAGSMSSKDDDEDDMSNSAVQLRGLPYRATVADIKAFLGPHADGLKGQDPVQIVQNRDGRPSGFAKVQFATPAQATAARDDLHRNSMTLKNVDSVGQTGTGQTHTSGNQDRYVEIFLFSERPNKLRSKKMTTGEAIANSEEHATVTRDDVLTECRQHMTMPGRALLLLSMLGVALSAAAHAYLKRTEQGLKHFLVQFPKEFAIDGAKGSERVEYLASKESAAMPSPAPSPWPQTPSEWGSPYPYSQIQGSGHVVNGAHGVTSVPQAITGSESGAVDVGLNGWGWPMQPRANWPVMQENMWMQHELMWNQQNPTYCGSSFPALMPGSSSGVSIGPCATIEGSNIVSDGSMLSAPAVPAPMLPPVISKATAQTQTVIPAVPLQPADAKLEYSDKSQASWNALMQMIG